MNCYQCDSVRLRLAPLGDQERRVYVANDIVLRICDDCGLLQNHHGDGEHLAPIVAAAEAPSTTKRTTLVTSVHERIKRFYREIKGA